MLSLPLTPLRTGHEPAQAIDRALFAAADYRKSGRRAHLRPGPNNTPSYLLRALVDLMTSTDRPEVYHDMVTATEMVAELIAESGGTGNHREAVLRQVAMDLHAARKHHPMPPTA
ncbi:hypothetical protein [Streptomyces ardesiacus]|uniref:hypothetical protein n=1 Tax=Streptomyces ardesiacus TaxID=285564 RepID=UPI000D58F7CD|nr:hypothetical protein [Streptomyces ardesiacus]